MKTKNLTALLICLFVVGLTLSFGQGPTSIDQLDQDLEENSSSIRNIIITIMDIVAAVFAVVGVVQLIQVFTAQSGDDKIKKSGNWMYVFVFVAIAWVLIRNMWLT